MTPTSKGIDQLPCTRPSNHVIYICSFLRRTFQVALNEAKPDIIVFLGDIFDEGSVARDDEYDGYLRRFHQIFRHDPKIPVSVALFPPFNATTVGGENGHVLVR